MNSEKELFDIATGLLDTFKYQRAIEFFTKVIAINPSNAEAFNLRGISNFKVYNIEQALADLSHAVELDPSNHSAWFNKGEILRFRKDIKEAEYCYRQANSINPDSLDYVAGLASVHMRLKKFRDAITYCDRILIESPADHIILYNRGYCYGKLKMYDEAIQDFLKLIDIGKKTATNFNNLGFYYSLNGNLQKARNNLSVALQINPTDPYALDNMGYVYYKLSQFTKAIEYINQSLQIDPSNSYAYKNRALVNLSLNKMDEALSDLKMAKTLGFADDHGEEVDELLKQFAQ